MVAYPGQVSENRPEPAQERQARLVRGPRMVPFLATGALIGALGGLLITMLGTESATGTAQQLVLLTGVLGLLGGLLGGVVYLVVERFTLR